MAESIVHKYFGHITSGAKKHIQHSDGAIRHGTESLLGGVLLGAVHADKGLDIKGRIPADVLGAVAGYAIAGMAPDSIAGDIRTLAGTGMTSFGFRQGFAFIAEKKKAKGQVPVGGFNTLGSTMHGELGMGGFGTDVGEDPIVALAKQL
jgi:hypothetical protein